MYCIGHLTFIIKNWRVETFVAVQCIGLLFSISLSLSVCCSAYRFVVQHIGLLFSILFSLSVCSAYRFVVQHIGLLFGISICCSAYRSAYQFVV